MPPIKTTLMLLLLNIQLLSITKSAITVGVNWGQMATHRLPPKTVVQMLLDNGFQKVKLFDADPETLHALSGSGIEVMVAIPNFMLEYLSSDEQAALDWVQENVTEYVKNKHVNIKYVAVGNEPFLTTYKNAFTKTTLPALQNIQSALLASTATSHIKATIPFNADIYSPNSSNSTLPSSGSFRPDILTLTIQILHQLRAHQAPFLVNIYPFLSLYSDPNFPLDFAFFEKIPDNSTLLDKRFRYSNVFDANFDTLVWALKKAGFPDMKIVIGEIGWPTNGDVHANVQLARKFNQGLLNHVESQEGTPMRKGEKIEVFLFSLFDENSKSIEPGNFERHWGIFEYDGKPKYGLDLTGRGVKRYLTGARDVNYMKRQWCVLKGGGYEEWEVKEEVEYACSRSDCTALGFGSDCNGLDLKGNVSYAFNMYYQMSGQDECEFGGLGEVSVEDPSVGKCRFPIMIDYGGVGEGAGYWWMWVVGLCFLMNLFVF